MQVKTTMRYHLTPIRMASSRSLEITSGEEDVEKREWKLAQPLLEQYGGSLKTKQRTTM